ncbi:hypothetical protein BH24ACT3_BH24ACT3_18230 [soil metagenome]
MTASSRQIALRLPADDLAAVDALVPEHHASRSEVIRRALDLYLYRLACERDAAAYDVRPLTDGELRLADDPGGWEATPAW